MFLSLFLLSIVRFFSIAPHEGASLWPQPQSGLMGKFHKASPLSNEAGATHIRDHDNYLIFVELSLLMLWLIV